MGRRVAGVVAAASMVAGATAVTAPAQAHDHGYGERSLATVLAMDGSGFDSFGWDYDIVDNAVNAVLANKPDSPVAVLADGSVPLTAFIPNDRAFRWFANDVFGKKKRSEAEVFAAVASLGIDTVETVLLSHVVPGVTITAKDALKADGVALPTALDGATFEVKVKRYDGGYKVIRLIDNDPSDLNPKVILPDINKGNKQIAHGIKRVLRPVDL